MDKTAEKWQPLTGAKIIQVRTISFTATDGISLFLGLVQFWDKILFIDRSTPGYILRFDIIQRKD
jgi:hypothetical protein